MGFFDIFKRRQTPTPPIRQSSPPVPTPARSVQEPKPQPAVAQMNPLELATLLANSNREPAQHAARTVWAGNDWFLELTINILGSKGAGPSGIPHEAGKRGAEILRDTCPPNRREVFQKLALGAFGPATAGISDSSSSNEKATLKEKTSKRMPAGNTENIEIYTASTKAVAFRHLESRQVVGMYTPNGVHRIIVNTPEGTWGKDASGIYDM